MKYNKIVGMVTKLAAKLRLRAPTDATRGDVTAQLLEKLYAMGLLTTAKSLENASKLSVSALCRRRLPVVMVRLKMSQTMKEAVTLIEQGHIRVGPHVVSDPAFLVTRQFEDFVTWVDTSKIRRHVAKYNDKLDDFDLLGE